jgi:hypothetical protein
VLRRKTCEHCGREFVLPKYERAKDWPMCLGCEPDEYAAHLFPEWRLTTQHQLREVPKEWEHIDKGGNYERHTETTEGV